MKPLTTKEFIDKAIKIHGIDKYDYSKVIYKASKKNVKIICNQCKQLFEQTPDVHLRQFGCTTCSIRGSTTKLTSEIFIERSKQRYGEDAFDYKSIEYKNNKTHVKLKCNKCYYEFSTRPDIHLNRCKIGCLKCTGKLQSNTSDFIKRSKLIHKDLYDYSNAKYENNSSLINIKCNRCNETFKQRAIDHISGHGCAYCGNAVVLTTKEFINRSKKIFKDKFDYSKTIYINSKTIVTLICKKHNFEFIINPMSHIYRKQDCIHCTHHGISKKQIEWLKYLMNKNNIYIQHALNDGELKIGKYKADGYCETNNTVYEFLGCVWHHCKKCFGHEPINKLNKKTMKEIHDYDKERENYIKSQGYNLVTIWEHEWDLQLKILNLQTSSQIICKVKELYQLPEEQAIKLLDLAKLQNVFSLAEFICNQKVKLDNLTEKEFNDFIKKFDIKEDKTIIPDFGKYETLVKDALIRELTRKIYQCTEEQCDILYDKFKVGNIFTLAEYHLFKTKIYDAQDPYILIPKYKIRDINDTVVAESIFKELMQ